jgi:hypothetical protein
MDISHPRKARLEIVIWVELKHEDPINLIATLIYKKNTQAPWYQPLSGFERRMQKYAADPGSATSRISKVLKDDLVVESRFVYVWRYCQYLRSFE